MQYKVIGLMSGTSRDGLDIAFCQFDKVGGAYTFELIATQHIEYDTDLKEVLKNAINLDVPDILELDSTYGQWIGEQVNLFIKKNKITPDFIANHGHTIHHRPEKGFTLQIGSGQEIALATKYPVVADFRSKDIALGGQGAPLVPIGDQLLFSTYDCCVNLGGISNLSFTQNNKRIAYDIAPVNMLLNYLSKKVGLEYDKNGKMASQGDINIKILQELNQLSYYTKSFPKSLGFEWFQDKVIPIIDKSQDSVTNLLRTSITHIVQQINLALQSIKKDNLKVLLTGGGAKNTFLIEQLQQATGVNIQIIVPSEELIDYKEALIFGFLGVLSKNKEINCLQSVTGASQDSSSGVWYYP
ncbi:anhydro-N-acetylmuramic acid kinase [Aquimarina sp. ERC-38]|uniref:anhydro-N-acetylmuramic acid kinase n=1 Tax=Aquimarina sp. ERC-38 TaxID=2949996 RepID=UPI002245BE20|nr:anhydro-N-acetylmuramic acid kinase [Aquimarina sp. ERC-38]UZO80398.1 anhydro-N-acetylmuramic acid kinase [Aquimarina sp. ERC-38]